MTKLSYHSIADLIPATTGELFIAYSGGIDSHVLLHLCATQTALKARVVAVYVHHGLQAVADDWEKHCRQQADALGIAFLSINVNAKASHGESPEAAARNARYQALQNLLQTGDLLLLAQHREDQMETLLLQLFRGAGIQGLAAMPVSTAFGLGYMLRPLLNVSKSEIRNYARQQALTWIEDPTNQHNDFDRNFLRNEIVPLLKQRWPSLDKTVARSARHCAEAATLLETWGQEAFGRIFDPTDKSLAIDKLGEFDSEQRNWLLRHWLDLLGLKPPSQALLQSINQQLIAAREDANPRIFTQAHYLKKYRQRLFCLSENRLRKLQGCQEWNPEIPTLTLSNGYLLTRATASAGIDKRIWHAAKITIKPRSGGEKLKLPGRSGQHDLKKLFQEAGIPPWEREIRPLLYLNDRLAAAAGLWVAEWAWTRADDTCYQLYWQPPESV
ncbi:tRNA lysidine(34) synthetase TilS [Methylomonas sp. LL1]|uniref:tRNA lysidine(34) synthetase TilS n=1 Tax=Methylomonas sp. LL1 TaxID=2785785 RepID=UPI0018C3A1C6|nr:tRNA lysidine(34) synthetase TilS [Methylomonas sp. LL1]QPK61519.1 tRNA lysidine(34) synthetase TilS [Methylomonas sp. LL1]